MMQLVQIVRDAWESVTRRSPDDPKKGLEWLRSQERDAHDATEGMRQRRIRETERKFLRDSDFLDNELFGESSKRKGQRR